jgi:hypothetical protein
MFSDEYIDTDCYDEEDCRIQACDAKFHIGPTRAIRDLTNVEWWQFRQPIDLLNFTINRSTSAEEYLTVGSCDPRIKSNQRSRQFSGSLYACKNDLAQCRLCRDGNCVSVCYAPCGMRFNYDVDESDPNVQDTPIYGDPIGAGEPVSLFLMKITECNETIAPGDYIRFEISATIVGKEHRFNYCQSLNDYDEETIPPEFQMQAMNLGKSAMSQDWMNKVVAS